MKCYFNEKETSDMRTTQKLSETLGKTNIKIYEFI